ncbi:MAG TPA: hypothetical protein DCQ98_03025 [Planctomycetaceae bacterium]|nr:hypothetical protein [Planctomycetaceae bacterium]
MIVRAIRSMGMLVAWVCVATVLAQLVFFAALWMEGGFDPERRLRLEAYLAGVDTEEVRKEVESKAAAARAAAGRVDRLGTMRRTAVTTGADHVRLLEAKLLDERQRYETIRALFESRLKKLAGERSAAAMETVRSTLEVLEPETAKDMLMTFLDDGALDDVVSVVTGMSADRQRKIFAEFRTPEEIQRLNDILLRIRGVGRDADDSAPPESTP